jgi:hypothetical protein
LKQEVSILKEKLERKRRNGKSNSQTFIAKERGNKSIDTIDPHRYQQWKEKPPVKIETTGCDSYEAWQKL